MKVPEKIVGTMPKEVSRKMKTCSVHGEYEELTMKIPGSGKFVTSGCYQCERDKEDAKWKRKQDKIRAEAIRSQTFKRSAIPRAFIGVKFSDYLPSCKDAETVMNRLANYAKNASAVKKTGSCALLMGYTGTGKTMLAMAVANELLNNGYTVQYMLCEDAIRWVKRSWSKDSTVSEDEYIERFKKPDFLFLDEIRGVYSPKEISILHGIINRRTMDLLPIVSITTVPEKAFREQMTDEIVRRLHYKGANLKFTWNKYEEENMLW